MASVNKVIILGNLGQDPEKRFFPSGDAVCNFSVATTETWKDKQTGERKEATEWHRVVCNGKLADIASEYLKKGSPVYIEGSIRTRKWTDKDGVDRYSTEIRVDQLKMLGSRGDGDQQGGGQRQQQAPAQRQAAPQGGQRQGASPAQNFDDSDVPFN